MTQRRFGLSKSRINAFEQCPKRLWLMVHRPELASPIWKQQTRLARQSARRPSMLICAFIAAATPRR